jgi:hypothetical protein
VSGVGSTCFALDPRDAVLMLAPHQCDAHPGVAGTSCAPAAVDVRLRLLGRLNLHNKTSKAQHSTHLITIQACGPMSTVTLTTPLPLLLPPSSSPLPSSSPPLPSSPPLLLPPLPSPPQQSRGQDHTHYVNTYDPLGRTYNRRNSPAPGAMFADAQQLLASPTCTTSSMPLISRPRAATSVATNTLKRPLLKPARVASRADWAMSPWRALQHKTAHLQSAVLWGQLPASVEAHRRRRAVRYAVGHTKSPCLQHMLLTRHARINKQMAMGATSWWVMQL